MTDLELAAYEWWLDRRPISFSESEHIANPTVNCATASERFLAKEVAAMRRRQDPSKAELP